MMFSFSIGSRGNMTESYTVRIPFVLEPGRTLKVGEENRFDLQGHTCEVAQGHNQYTLIVRGFDTEEDALSFLPKACAGLIWFGLKRSIGLQFNPDPSEVTLFPEPKPIADKSNLKSLATKQGWETTDGHYDANRTVVVPEHKRLISFMPGQASVRMDSPVSMLAEGMAEGIADGQPQRVMRNEKLRLACEVYLSSHFESSTSASFLSRITVLELLAPDTPASGPLQEMVDRYIAEARAAKRKQGDEYPALSKEIDSLLGRLENLKTQSIGNSVCDLVRQNLPPDQNPENTAREVKKLYDLRSRMVHEGGGDTDAIRQGNNRLNTIVPILLQELFKNVTHEE